MDFFKTISENPAEDDRTKIVMSKVRLYLLFINIFLFQEKEIIPLIKNNIAKIVKELNIAKAALFSLDIVLSRKEFKTPEEKLAFLMSFKDELVQLVTLELYNKAQEEPMNVLRHFFKFYAQFDQLFVEGIKFFSLFQEFIKVQKFNPVKSFLFYFAYQTKKYNFPEVKELLGQQLLTVNISDGKVYLEFCMYCFYKGLYYIERKNFFMASYLYSVAVSMGLRGNVEDCKVVNCFSMQMIRSLCFLRFLSDFEIRGYIFKDHRGPFHIAEDSAIIKYEDIQECLNYIKNEKTDLQTFNSFLKSNKNFENYKLKGLIKEAEEALIFKKIKDTLCMYKKIQMAKLSQKTQIEFNDLMRVMKKKVLDGEIAVKYDEATDIVEVFDMDPGLKERVEKTKEIYKNVIEANKNLFINLKDKKMRELSQQHLSKEEQDLELAIMRQEEYDDEEYYTGGMDLD